MSGSIEGTHKITDLGLLEIAEEIPQPSEVKKLFLKLDFKEYEIQTAFTNNAGLVSEVTIAYNNLLIKWKHKVALNQHDNNINLLTAAMRSINKADKMVGVVDVEDATLFQIAQQIGDVTCINKLGLKLGFTDGEIKTILSNESFINSITMVSHDLFMNWKSRVAFHTESDKINILKEALNAISKPDLINRLKQN